MKTIGSIENGKIVKEYVQLGANFGTIYKNFEAFNNKTTEICYVPELTEDDEEESYTYQDFIDLAKGTFENLGVNGDVEKMAKLLFDSCEWQSPETIIDEWLNSDEFDEYPETYGIN